MADEDFFLPNVSDDEHVLLDGAAAAAAHRAAPHRDAGGASDDEQGGADAAQGDEQGDARNSSGGDDDEEAAAVGEDIAAHARALSDRSKTVRQLFIQDEASPDHWICCVEVDAVTKRKCGVRVKQAARTQSSNLLAHLKAKHNKAVSLPDPRKRVSKRAREAAAAAVADAAAVAALPPAAAQAAAVRNVAADEEEVVDLFVRRSLAFALADDPFFAKRFGGGRHAMAQRIAASKEVKLAALKRALRGVEVVIISDAGTHHGKQSVDVVMQVDCIPTAIAVAYPLDTTAVTLQGHLQEAANGFKVLAFVSDNAANFVAAGTALAAEHKCFQCSCGAHSVQIVARSLLIPGCAAAIADVDALRDNVRRVAKDLPKIPVEIESRWNATYKALQAANKHWPLYFQRELMDDAARRRIAAALDVLRPAAELTLELEADRATVFNNVSAFARLLLPFVGKDNEAEAYRIFLRDVFSVPFVAALTINPALKWAMMPKWVSQSLQQSLATAIDIATRCGADVARAHALTWANGLAQRQWELSDTTAHQFLVNPPRAAAPIKVLYEKLLKIPASSAAVERAYSTHTAIHSDARASLEHIGVESSLVLRSIKQRERAGEVVPFPPPLLSSDDAFKLAAWCAQAASGRAIAAAPIGSRITAFYRDRGNLIEHVGVIIGKPNATKVTVRWADRTETSVDHLDGEVFLGVA